MTILVQDSFNRADSTTGLGTADTGQSWTALLAVWGIQTNRAYWVNGNPALHVIDSGQSNVQISLDNIVASSGQTSGAIAFRVSDSTNYWFFRNLSNVNQLYKVVGGTATLVASQTYNLSAATFVFKVIANGSTIECYVNDVLQFTATDTHNQTATKHGLRNHTTTTTRFDNFLVESLGATGTDGSTSFDLKQVLYNDSFISADTKQALYQDSSMAADTKQMIFADGSTSFDTLQGFFSDGIIGATPFDVRIVLYNDNSIVSDTKQALYTNGSFAADTKQSIYQDGNIKGDVKTVIFADSAQINDLMQSFYQDGFIDFDTLQKISDGDPILAFIRLKGKQVLEVNLVGKQVLDIELKGKQENGIRLKGLIQ